MLNENVLIEIGAALALWGEELHPLGRRGREAALEPAGVVRGSLRGNVARRNGDDEAPSRFQGVQELGRGEEGAGRRLGSFQPRTGTRPERH